MSSSGKNTALCPTLLQPEVRGAVVQPVSGGHGGQRGVQLRGLAQHGRALVPGEAAGGGGDLAAEPDHQVEVEDLVGGRIEPRRGASRHGKPAGQGRAVYYILE